MRSTPWPRWTVQRGLTLAVLGLAVLGARAEAPAATETAAPELPYAAAVAARFPPPEQRYDTPGLQPGRTSWTDNAELEAALRAIAARGAAQLLDLGRTPVGHPVLALHFGPAGADSGATAEAPRRPLALLLGQQHGNEPAGAEALLVLAQRLADAASPLAAVRARLDVVVLPRVNPDGSLLGRRGNAAGLDINRDHLRLRTAEAAMVADLARRWRPVLVVDVHEHAVLARHLPRFGGIKRHDLLWQHAGTPNLPAALPSATDAIFGAALERAMAAQGLTIDWYYTNPRDDTGLRLDMGGLQPDLARNAQGLRHAVSVLLESRGYDLGRLHAQRRVHTHVVALSSLMASAAAHAPALLALQDGLDAQVASLACQGDVVLRAAVTRSPRPLLMLDPETGADKPVLVDWGSARELVTLAARPRPCGYWLAPDAGDAAARLQRLGLAVQPLSAGQRLRVERYRPTALETGEPARAPDPPPVPRRVRVDTERDAFEAPEGSFYVPLDQPLAHLAVAALEPDTDSSWFAHHLVPELASVMRVMSPP